MKWQAVCVLFSLLCSAEEVFDAELEKECLANVMQVTSESMGFVKAGESYFSPDGESLIFQAVPIGEKDYQIYTIHLSSGVLKRVSTGLGACTCGYYKPDGSKILFASSHESPLPKEEKKPVTGKYTWDLTPYMNLYEGDPDGLSLCALTSGPAYHAECSYSPDGSQIVYASNEDGHMNLYTCRADGTYAQQLTFFTGSYNGGPFFSPDGRWIVFRADRQRKDYLQLYMIRPDGSEEVQLTDNDFVNWSPFWHPEGKVIAYTTSKHGHGAYEIYLLNIETKAEHRLTHSNSFDGLASFSSDGKRITWTSKRGGRLSSGIRSRIFSSTSYEVICEIHHFSSAFNCKDFCPMSPLRTSNITSDHTIAGRFPSLQSEVGIS